MTFKEIVDSKKELQESLKKIKEIKKEVDLVDKQLDTAKGKVGWKDKLNIFSTTEDEKEVKKIRGDMNEKRKEMDDLSGNLVKEVLKMKVTDDPNYLFQIMLRVFENVKTKTEAIETELVESGQGENKRTQAKLKNKDELVNYINTIVTTARQIGGSDIPTAAHDLVDLSNEIKRELEI